MRSEAWKREKYDLRSRAIRASWARGSLRRGKSTFEFEFDRNIESNKWGEDLHIVDTCRHRRARTRKRIFVWLGLQICKSITTYSRTTPIEDFLSSPSTWRLDEFYARLNSRWTPSRQQDGERFLDDVWLYRLIYYASILTCTIVCLIISKEIGLTECTGFIRVGYERKNVCDLIVECGCVNNKIRLNCKPKSFWLFQ